MNWMFLHCPQDGDVMLVWQPPQMGMAFGSDGYIWADPEAAFTSEMRGYVRHLSTLTSSMPLIDGILEGGNVPSTEWLPSTS